MNERDKILQERRLVEVLKTGLDTTSKINRVILLGFSESAATRLVERHQIGRNVPAFYESLARV
jgi:hypothetical protein